MNFSEISSSRRPSSPASNHFIHVLTTIHTLVLRYSADSNFSQSASQPASRSVGQPIDRSMRTTIINTVVLGELLLIFGVELHDSHDAGEAVLNVIVIAPQVAVLRNQCVVWSLVLEHLISWPTAAIQHWTSWSRDESRG